MGEEAAELARMSAVDRAERERLEVIAAAERAEVERQANIRLRKQSIKKLKEIQLQEEKMAAKGQTIQDVLPEVQDKLSKKGELEAKIVELHELLGDADA